MSDLRGTIWYTKETKLTEALIHSACGFWCGFFALFFSKNPGYRVDRKKLHQSDKLYFISTS